MSLSSPPCYLGLIVSDADWIGPSGGKQVARLEGWRLSIEPLEGVGWHWSLHTDGPEDLVDARAEGMVRFEDVVSAEAEAKTRAADAWAFAQEHDESS
jgi:hypothetical protein